MAISPENAYEIANNLQNAIDEVWEKLEPMLEFNGNGKMIPHCQAHVDFVKLNEFYCNLIDIRDGNFKCDLALALKLIK